MAQDHWTTRWIAVLGFVGLNHEYRFHLRSLFLQCESDIRPPSHPPTLPLPCHHPSPQTQFSHPPHHRQHSEGYSHQRSRQRFRSLSASQNPASKPSQLQPPLERFHLRLLSHNPPRPRSGKSQMHFGPLWELRQIESLLLGCLYVWFNSHQTISIRKGSENKGGEIRAAHQRQYQ